MPRLAFIGFATGFLGYVTEHVQAQWICAWFRGEIQLPRSREMCIEIRRVLNWKKENVLDEPAVYYATSCRFFQYMDELLLDMGIQTHRRTFQRSVFSTWGPDDYASLRAERIIAANRQT